MDKLTIDLTYDYKPNASYTGEIANNIILIHCTVGESEYTISFKGGFAYPDDMMHWMQCMYNEFAGFSEFGVSTDTFTEFVGSQWFKDNVQTLHKLSEALHDLQMQLDNRASELTSKMQARLDKDISELTNAHVR